MLNRLPDYILPYFPYLYYGSLIMGMCSISLLLFSLWLYQDKLKEVNTVSDISLKELSKKEIKYSVISIVMNLYFWAFLYILM